MGLKEHIRRNWVEYLLLGVAIFFLARNKKVQVFVKKIVDKMKKQFLTFLKEK